MKKKKYGFTLIELLAVIIILGILMVIAIPSVTNYIQSSRKNAYSITAKEYVKGLGNIVNSGKLNAYDPDVTYYYPIKCIATESGGNSPFGDWVDAYVVFTANDNGFDYYWTSVDSANMGVHLTYSELLDEESVLPDVKEISNKIGIGDRSKVSVFDENSCDVIASTVEADDYIEERSKSNGVFVDYSNYLTVTSANVLNHYFYYDFDKNTAEKVIIERHKNVPANAVASGNVTANGVDVSKARNGSIMMWLTDENNNGKLEVHIGQDGGVVANSNSTGLFSVFNNVCYFDVTYLKTKNASSMKYMFSNACKNTTADFKIIGLDRWDVSNVTDFESMFSVAGYYSKNFDIGDLSNWNVSNALSMKKMFWETGSNANSINLGDLSRWNVSNVTNMNNMFYALGSHNVYIGDISSWNVSNVTDMSQMFDFVRYLELDLSRWDVSKVTAYNSFSSDNIVQPHWVN